MSDGRERNRLSIVGAGAARGVVATLAMSGVMLGWQSLIGGGRLAPALVSRHAMRRIDVRPSQRVARNAAETLAHFVFGASAGVAYALSSQALLHLLPGARRVPAPVRGGAYGLGVWALSYGVGIPALGLLPPPDHDRPGRQRRLVTAHLIYGATLGAGLRRRQDS